MTKASACWLLAAVSLGQGAESSCWVMSGCCCNCCTANLLPAVHITIGDAGNSEGVSGINHNTYLPSERLLHSA